MKILNLHTDDCRNAAYVARPSPLGNPYAIGRDGDRETVIAKYQDWLDRQIAHRDPVVLTALLGIRPDQDLACYCAPQACHAEIIRDRLQAGLQDSLRSREGHTFRYAGIGSRNTPDVILKKIRLFAKRLEELGYTVLSGGANGADSAFTDAVSRKEVYLPWPNFADWPEQGLTQTKPHSDAFRVAACLHPYWSRLKDSAKALHARNSHQILGEDLRSPVDFVLCWTPDGCESERQRSAQTGGTGQAIALADRWGIPVINLKNGPEAVNRLTHIVEEGKAYAEKKADPFTPG